jgi:lipid-A-disaccharide synthase
VQPVSRILPPFLEAFEILIKGGRNIQALLPVSDERIRKLVEPMVRERKTICDQIKIVDRDHDLPARVALMSSGTMSLSCAWAGVPGVIGYRAHPITYMIGKKLVGVPYLGMANLLLPDDPPNPEFLQGRATGSVLAAEIAKILDNPQAGKQAAEISQKLHGLLAKPKERGVVDWLIQEGRLG